MVWLLKLKQNFYCGEKRWTQITKVNSYILLSPTFINNTNSITIKGKAQIVLSDTAIDAYVQCTEAFYPNMKVLLKISAILIVI